MAKKVVATLKREGGVKYAKVIKPVKSPSGSYSFKSEIIPESEVQAYFKK
ncbi:MAG: DUF4295 domain-containing protein [Cytophagales bacterium]|nr:DUF4295 domain-containing protein [Cytophagales bacterium]MDW8383371.1 DUF4295 family protein [Flammeovirgaceae bacterium]